MEATLNFSIAHKHWMQKQTKVLFSVTGVDRIFSVENEITEF